MANDLSEYRGTDGGVQPVDDTHDDGGAVSQQSAATPAPGGDDEPADPPVVGDSARQALAARFAARRAANRAISVPRSHVPSVDGDITDPDDPDYIAPAEEDGDEPAPREPAKPAARRFTLKVDGNTFDVSREEAFRYAGLDPDADAGLPEPSVVRAAQINLAAQARLDEAKRERDTQRTRKTATESGIPADEASTPPDETQTRRSAKPGSETVDMVRDIQYGDPEEAAAKIEQYLENRLTQRETTRTAQSFVEEVQSHIADFGRENGDLASDDVAAETVKSLMVRGIVQDLKAHGITDAEATQLLNNPELASKAYIGARASGYAVRPMKTILDEAGSTVRSKFRMDRAAPADPTPTPRASTPSRRDEKRTLVSQPAPSGMPPERRQPGPSTLDRQAVASRRIQQMKSARFQG